MKTVVLWCCAFVTGAALLVATDYKSRDPDSALYAKLSEELAPLPISHWIAPDWGGAWNQEGPFREHPVGILLLPALLIRCGFPAEQAAYVVNMLYQIAVILLIPVVAGQLVKGFEARSLAWLLQLLPVAFAYRIRANQEHPLLMCFLAALYATHRSRTHPAWISLMVVSFCCMVLIKGAFAMFALAAAVLWLLLVPKPAASSNWWPWVGLVTTVTAAGAMMAGYETLYVHATGDSFLDFYNTTRLGGSIRLTDAEVLPHALANAAWYLSRLVWFAAPWSAFALAAVWVWVRSQATDADPRVFDETTERGLLWVLLLAAVYIVILSPALVRAERFIFPTYFAIGAMGAVTAIRSVAGMRRLVMRTDQHAWLPVAVWIVTFLLNLASRMVGLMRL